MFKTKISHAMNSPIFVEATDDILIMLPFLAAIILGKNA